jgi:integrase
VSEWIQRWNDWIAPKPEIRGVWRRRDGGFRVRGHATDPNTGRLREVNRTLPTCKRATVAAKELESALDAIRKGGAAAAGQAIPRFAAYAVELLGRKVANGDIASAAGREKWGWILEKHLIPRFGDWYLDKLTKVEIERWKSSLAEGYSPNTVNTILSVLKAIFSAACDDYKALENPVAKVKPLSLKRHRTYSEEEPNALAPDDVWRFLDEVRVRCPEHYAMIYLGMVTGWRPSMLRPLRRKGPHADIDWNTGVVKARRSHTIGDETMEGTKDGNDWVVKLPAEALDMMRWHVERLEKENAQRAKRSPENAAAMAASELLFPCEPNGRNRGGGFRTKSSLARPFDVAGKAIGLSYSVTPRALRRSFQDLCREGSAVTPRRR